MSEQQAEQKQVPTTPEYQLKVCGCNSDSCGMIHDEIGFVAWVYGFEDGGDTPDPCPTRKHRKVLRERIVARHNACAGIPDPQAALDAAREALDQCLELHTRMWGNGDIPQGAHDSVARVDEIMVTAMRQLGEQESR